MNLERANKVVCAARKKAEQIGISATVTVVDKAGRLVVTMRGDGTGYLTTETSKGKAKASAAFGISTREMERLYTETKSLFWSALPGFASEVLPTTGACPLFEDGKLIGAVGCGGGTKEQDHLCAEAGALSISELNCHK